MLVSLLRHGISTSLKARAIRNGSSTATSDGFGSSSRGVEGGLSSWTTADHAGQNEGASLGNLKQPIKVGPGTADVRTSVIPASNSDEEKGKRGEPGARTEPGYDATSMDKQDDIHPSFRKRHDNGGSTQMLGEYYSKKGASLEVDPPASSYIGRELKKRSAVGNQLSKSFTGGSSLIGGVHEEDLKGGDAVRDVSSKALEGSLSADSSFLDGLDDGVSTRTFLPTIDESVPVEAKLVKLRQLMAAGDPRRLLTYMWRESEDLKFMRAIPVLTFVEVLRQFHPGDEFLPLRSDYKELGPKHYRLLTGWRQKMYNFLHERRRLYHDIFERRIESGATLAVGEYAQLLNLTRSTWDGPMALDIMREMKANGIRPNLICYNHYFEARCWSDAYHPSESQQLRVIPRNAEMRKEESRRLVPGGVVVAGHQVDENGIRLEITQMFTKMVNEGINADTRAYCNLIIAYSREGDLLAIKFVLKQVWNVDIDALLAGKPEHDRQRLRKDDPTYPTGDLLYCLAHAFGSNNDIPAAMQIVAHFSSKYQIDISQAVWCELLEWTFVLSARRRKYRVSDGTSTGQLPLRSVESLFNVMLSPPYNGKPTLRMYDFLLRSFERRSRIHPTLLRLYLDRMREGVKIHEQACTAFTESRSVLAKMRESGGVKDSARLDAQQAKVAQAWKERWFSFVLVRKWLVLLLSCARWLRNVEERERIWTRRLLPNAIEEFWRFKMNKPFTYSTATGRVELEDQEGEAPWATKQLASHGNTRHEMKKWKFEWLTQDESDGHMEDPEAEAESFEIDETWDASTDAYSDPQGEEEEGGGGGGGGGKEEEEEEEEEEGEVWDDENPDPESKGQADP